MINIVKKYLERKIHEVIGSSDDSWPQLQNKYIATVRLLQYNYWWLFPLFRYVLHTKFPFFQKLTPYPYIFFHLESILWNVPQLLF